MVARSRRPGNTSTGSSARRGRPERVRGCRARIGWRCRYRGLRPPAGTPCAGLRAALVLNAEAHPRVAERDDSPTSTPLLVAPTVERPPGCAGLSAPEAD